MKYYIEMKSEEEVYCLIRTFFKNDQELIKDVLYDYYNEYYNFNKNLSNYWDFSDKIFFHVTDYYFLGKYQILYFFRYTPLKDYDEKKYHIVMRKNKINRLIVYENIMQLK